MRCALLLKSGGNVRLKSGGKLLLHTICPDTTTVGIPAGKGRPYRGKLRPQHFTKKGWEEYQALLAAEEAALDAEQADAIAPAAQEAEQVLDALGEMDDIEPFGPDVTHLAELLNAAASAAALHEAIERARAAAEFGHRLYERILQGMDEDDAIELLLLS